MIVTVRYPETDEGKKLLHERLAKAQINLIKDYIEKLPCEPERKLMLFDNVKQELKNRAEAIGN